MNQSEETMAASIPDFDRLWKTFLREKDGGGEHRKMTLKQAVKKIWVWVWRQKVNGLLAFGYIVFTLGFVSAVDFLSAKPLNPQGAQISVSVMTLGGILIIGYWIYVLWKTRHLLAEPEMNFLGSLRTLRGDEISKALEIKALLSPELLKAFTTFAEGRKERMSGRFGIIAAGATVIFGGFLSTDLLKATFGVSLERIHVLLLISATVSVGVVFFSFFSTQQANAASYVCSILNLAADNDFEVLKKLQIFIEGKKSNFSSTQNP